jgi:hypothetical protein
MDIYGNNDVYRYHHDDLTYWIPKLKSRFSLMWKILTLTEIFFDMKKLLAEYCKYYWFMAINDKKVDCLCLEIVDINLSKVEVEVELVVIHIFTLHGTFISYVECYMTDTKDLYRHHRLNRDRSYQSAPLYFDKAHETS